tara:strand:+ start:76 stop:420 length:345 start_codon:yes stop_codon:yes gene_type:complete
MFSIALLAAACGGDTDKGTDSACIEGAAQDSVQVTVTDSLSAPLPDAVVTWNNGGEEQPCDAIGTQHLCGRDIVGTVSVTGTAEGYTPKTITVDVESDGCHAITVREALRLDAE